MRRNWTCDNCNAEKYCDQDHLPNGWRWHGMTHGLDGFINDEECMLICNRCADGVTAALKALEG